VVLAKVVDDPVATARGSDTRLARRRFLYSCTPAKLLTALANSDIYQPAKVAYRWFPGLPILSQDP
jgi:hypothetical protein